MRLFSALLALLVSTSAIADGKTLTDFLTAMNGLWRGSGVYRQTQWDGSRAETGYTLSSDYAEEKDLTWLVKNQLQTNTGQAISNSYRLAVKKDSLYIGNPSPVEQATVVDSTADSLTYRLTRVDAPNLRVYTYTYEYRIRTGRLGDRVLLGRSTIEMNGMLLADDQYTLDEF